MAAPHFAAKEVCEAAAAAAAAAAASEVVAVANDDVLHTIPLTIFN